MTLGVLEPYRRLSLGSLLLETILDSCQSDPNLSAICLHVHVGNSAAIAFYAKYGFKIHERCDGYYLKNTGVKPPDAFFLVRRCRKSYI